LYVALIAQRLAARRVRAVRYGSRRPSAGAGLWELASYLDANADALPTFGARCRTGQPISTGFAKSAVNQILAPMIKRRQMRWNRDTVQPCLTVRVAVLNDTLERAFRSWHTGFAPVEKISTPCAA
jgi:hypothetical protein